MGSKKRKRKSRVSSGRGRVSRAKKALTRIKMKIVRWNKNQTDEAKKAAGKSRRGWITDGLERHVKTLQQIIKQGPKKKRHILDHNS